MAKVKFAKWEFTGEELEKQFAEATERGEEAERTQPRAAEAYYSRESHHLVIKLVNGTVISIPVGNIQGLADASPDEISQVELIQPGNALHWEKLDVDFSVPGLVAGILGTRAWMGELGRRGGSSSSEAKAAAARANGRKGGRPAKIKGVQHELIEAPLLKPREAAFTGNTQVVQHSPHLTMSELVKAHSDLRNACLSVLKRDDPLVAVEGRLVNHPEPFTPAEAFFIGQEGVNVLFSPPLKGIQAAANTNDLALAA